MLAHGGRSSRAVAGLEGANDGSVLCDRASAVDRGAGCRQMTAAIHLRLGDVNRAPQHRKAVDLGYVAMKLVIANNGFIELLTLKRPGVCVHDILEIID